MPHTQPDELKLLPAYPLAVAARFLGSNASTLRAWFRGRDYIAGGNRRRSRAVLSTKSNAGEPISFIDLVEAHVLMLVRQCYHLPMKNFRAAAETLTEIKGVLNFLAHKDFYADHKNLFLEIDGKLVSLSERGQRVDKEIISKGLKQLSYGGDGFAERFYPLARQVEQKDVFLDPKINFGRPCLASICVSTEAVAERFFAGEKIIDLAKDYGTTPAQVETALRWHELKAA